MTETLALPQWSEARSPGGRDLLGMQNPGVVLYGSLVPGITNQTERIRYYGFHAWVAHCYAYRTHSPDRAEWRRFLRRCECLYALIGAQAGTETGMGGSEWAWDAMTKTEDEVIRFRDVADPDGSGKPYLKAPEGVFGAIYANQLFGLGILTEADNHDLPVPSNDVGEDLACAYAKAIAEYEGSFLRLVECGEVARNALGQFQPMLPSRIADNSEERGIYEDLMFARLRAGAFDLSRQRTLRLILHIAHSIKATPSADEVRWSLYSSHLPDGETLVLPEVLDAHRREWWDYHIADLSHICFESLLRFVFDTLSEYPAGLPLSALVNECVDRLIESADAPPGTWRDWLDEVGLPQNASSPSDPHSERSLADPLVSAGAGYDPFDPARAWVALRLLATIHQRWRSRDESGGQEQPAFPGAHERYARSIVSESAFLDEQLDAPFEQTLQRLIQSRTIQRHLWVAMQKLTLQGSYTFALEVDDGRVRTRLQVGPVYTNPRLRSAISFLREIHLLDDSGPTADGQRCLEEFI